MPAKNHLQASEHIESYITATSDATANRSHTIPESPKVPLYTLHKFEKAGHSNEKNDPAGNGTQTQSAAIYTVSFPYSYIIRLDVTPVAMTKIYHAILHSTLTNAPIPTALAVFGFESRHTRNNTSPTTGIQHPSNPQPIPPVSFETAGCSAPQCEQIFALSSIWLPHF